MAGSNASARVCGSVISAMPLLLCLLLLPVTAAAQGPASLVKDIYTSDADSSPSALTNVGGTLFFAAADGAHGNELWKSDGTDAGTMLVKDINPGPATTFVDRPELTDVNGMLFLVTGVALWKSDGSETGTVRVKNFPLRPRSLKSVNRTLVFVVDDGFIGAGSRMAELGRSNATEASLDTPAPTPTPPLLSSIGGLWRSDGTEAGTVSLKNFPNGNLSDLISVNDTVFFVAYERELWASDGTPAGTRLIRRLIGDFQPYSLTSVNGLLFFMNTPQAIDGVMRLELWRSDGTAAGTFPVQQFEYSPRGPVLLTNVNGTLFFIVSQHDSGPAALWRSDGTVTGTVPLKDFELEDPPRLMNVNGTLFLVVDVFDAGDQATHTTLWRSNGTTAGTVQVAELLTTALDAVPVFPRLLTSAGGMLFFENGDGHGGAALWRSDGTDSGTVRVKDINPDPAGIAAFAAVNGTLFFAASDGHTGIELWRSNGTEAGTVQVKNINRSALSANPSALTEVNRKLFFVADDGSGAPALWRSDGTEGGTVPVQRAPFGLPSQLTSVNGQLLFVAGGSELRKSDGTEAETVRLLGGPGRGLSDLTVVNDTLFFVNRILRCAICGVAPRELWRSDGSEAGTVRVMAFATTNILRLASLTNLNGTLMFVAGVDLWRSDGTSEGTARVRQFDVAPAALTNLDGMLVFTVGSELWRSDGTEAGTERIVDFGPTGSVPAELTSVNGTLFVVAYNASGGGALWKSDGSETGTVRVKDFSGEVSNLTGVNGTLLFTAFEERGGVELWRSDGTETGSVQVKDIRPGEGSSSPSSLTVLDGKLLFSADDGTSGRELWRSDGTERGTVRIQDIEPGPLSADPDSFTVAAAHVFFAATNASYGRELWDMPLSAVRVRCAGDCDGDGQVSVDEVLMLVNIALGNAQGSACQNGIPSGVQVDVALIMQAVDNALSGCRDG